MASDDSSSLLAVEKSELVLVKPSKPTPVVSLSLSTIDNNPFLEFIVNTICIYAPKSYLDDQADHDLTSLLQHALSDVLFYYYPLAGKLHRKPDDNRLQLNCTAGDGVPFIRATATCTLSSLEYLDNADHLDSAYQLVPCYETVEGCEGYDPLALQVTKFACGGITIGIAHSHSVCDGVGVAQFFRAMIELAFGMNQPTVIPVWNREMLTFNGNLGDVVDYPKAEPSIPTSSYTSSNDIVRHILSITSDDIKKLKKTIAEEEENTNEKKEKVAITTLEILAAYVWRTRCRALNMSPEEIISLNMAIGIRNIMEPPIPEGYYGNAVVNSSVALTARELSESSLSRVVKLIREMKRASLDKRYVSGQLNMMERMLEVKKPLESIGIGSMMLTDWRQIGLHYNGLLNIIPLIRKALPNLCIFLPASKAIPGMSGGVRVLIMLPRDAMAKFKEEISAL